MSRVLEPRARRQRVRSGEKVNAAIQVVFEQVMQATQRSVHTHTPGPHVPFVKINSCELRQARPLRRICVRLKLLLLRVYTLDIFSLTRNTNV